VEVIIQQGVVANGDRQLLHVVMQNLLDNSWKFTGKHSHAKIEFGVDNSNSKPTYFVRDDGSGFEMDYADKLYLPFQRLHTPDEFPGTGIGLATVQRIIHRHGGRIWAESAVEKGTTFYFSLL
jgi:light-regulated signal transduction histidine kinase (bacteriophytochrome)